MLKKLSMVLLLAIPLLLFSGCLGDDKEEDYSIDVFIFNDTGNDITVSVEVVQDDEQLYKKEIELKADGNEKFLTTLKPEGICEFKIDTPDGTSFEDTLDHMQGIEEVHITVDDKGISLYTV